METLSSSFLQKFCPAAPSATASSPPLLQILKISSVKIDENYERSTEHRTPIKPNTSSSTGSKFQTSNESETRQIIARKNQSFLTGLFNSLDNFICHVVDPPLRPFADPKIVLSGNDAPVDELPPTACEVVEGSLPPCLDGAYIRNGPNPRLVPRGPYHIYDGDGMLHAITISDGKATFCSRFVQTYKYKVEREIGSPVFINYFSAFTNLPASLARMTVVLGRILSGQYDPRGGSGCANTSLAYFGGQLFALCESDLPYRIKITPDGDIITLSRHEAYGGGERQMSMTAHPKVDKDTDEAFAFRHSFWRPFLTYFRINSDGTKQPEVPIYSMAQASMVHDIAISKNFAIFPDIQVVMNLGEMIKGKPPVRVDPKKVPRLGIIPRYTEDESEMWWVEAPGLNLLHAVNAWEEDGGDTVVMVGPNVLSVEHMLERLEMVHISMELVEIDLKAKILKRRPLSGRSLDFGVINPAYVAKKTRYMYAALISPMPKVSGVVKLDLSLSTAESGDCVVASRLYGPGCYGGEPFFVAREPDNPSAAEDDGYLVTYMFDENSEESRFLVMDAKSPSLEVVASVKLPQRVPYGFHGIFVPECDLGKLQ